MGKFEKQAKELLDAIGGKENVAAVTHCATRMRFVLNDDAKADKKESKLFQRRKACLQMPDNFKSSLAMTLLTFIMTFQQSVG